MHALKHWFLNLSKREQYIVGVGGLFGIICFFYGIIWSPLVVRVDILRQKVRDSQNLLMYVEHAKKKIFLLRAGHNIRVTPVSNIMVDVERALAEKHLAQYLKHVQQPAADEVTIELHAVPFDIFIGWLQDYVSTHFVSVVAFQASKQKTFGTVNVQFTLSKRVHPVS